MTRDQRHFTRRRLGRPSLTAEGVTMARAIEHLKPPADRIVNDPFAHLFLSPAAGRALRTWSRVAPSALRRAGAGMTSYVALRHRYIDDQLLASLDAGVEQIVLLGAGYDARAYRFADELDGRPVFELDLAPISRAKAAIVARHRSAFPTSNVRRVEIDFETQQLREVLEPAGFVPGEQTFFVWEGVAMYLTRGSVASTLDAVHALAGDRSRLAQDQWQVVDDPGPRGVASRAAAGALALVGEPVTFAMHPEDYEHFLRRHGFRVLDVMMATELASMYAPDASVRLDDSLYVLTTETAEPEGDA
jgi:methyltransferase (TIGR00027 family)